MNRRVLVVGGAGVFGSRLVRGLADTTDLAILIAGRSLARAEALAGEVRRQRPEHAVEAAALDVRTVTAKDMAPLDVTIVVDAAGPFQGSDYRLARAAIGAGVHYVDLADARDFVAGFPMLDEAARRAGVTAVSGASSTPALSNAVLDHLTAHWRRVDSVDIAISPGNRTPRGPAVVRSILSYCGQPVRVFLNGCWTERPGWGLLTRRTLSGLGRRWLSLCETPDLDIVAQRFRVSRSAVFRAGLELSVLHLGLSVATSLVRLGLVRSLAGFAAPFHRIANALIGFGTDRGGMTVEAQGIDSDGRPIRRTWTLVAEDGDGPFVPTLPALAMVKALADGHLRRPGAQACVGLLDLAAIEAEFRRFRIATRIETEQAAGPSLFARALGDDFARLPRTIQEVHTPGNWLILNGRGGTDGPDDPLGRLVGALFRLPGRADDVPVRVSMEPRGDGERWCR